MVPCPPFVQQSREPLFSHHQGKKKIQCSPPVEKGASFAVSCISRDQRFQLLLNHTLNQSPCFQSLLYEASNAPNSKAFVPQYKWGWFLVLAPLLAQQSAFSDLLTYYFSSICFTVYKILLPFSIFPIFAFLNPFSSHFHSIKRAW